MCNDSSNPSPCNRRPFASDDGCDRGSVDIFQFDDFPYCGNIDPTMPDIPPEVQDGPIPIPLPAYSCTCFNINYKFDLKYNENRTGNSFSTSASFAAVGDCCEGMYETRFKLRIPCPVKNKQGRRIRVGIAYGSGPQSASESFIAADSSNCIIEPLSPSLNLNIPCPVAKRASAKSGMMNVGIAYGNGPNNVDASFIKIDSGGCGIEALRPWIRLNIPCPVSDTEAWIPKDKKIKVGISYGSGPNEASGVFVTEDHRACTIKGSNANLKLNIPCPIIGDGAERRIKASIKYGNGPSEVSQTLAATDMKNCNVDIKSPDLALNIPCPLDGIAVTTSYRTTGGNGSLSVSQGYDQLTCKKTINIHADFPDRGQGMFGRIRVVKGISFNGTSLTVCYGYIEFSGGRSQFEIDGGCETVFSATPHGGCC